MSAQEQELDELLRMLQPKMIGLFANIRAERDLYKARYECIAKFMRISCKVEKNDWCELTGHVVLHVNKCCATVDEAVDFVLGGNGNEQATLK